MLSDAYNDCRRRAFDRLRSEAELAGADAVVGVRVTAARYEWATDLIEFQAIGTAVRAPGLRTPAGPGPHESERPGLCAPARRRPPAVRRRRRHEPSSSAPSTPGRSRSPPTAWGAWANVEMVGATQTWYHARRRVLEMIEADAAALGATGIVATDWGQEERPYESGDRLAGITYTIHALATAIAPARAIGAAADIASVLSLSKETR